MLYYSQDTHKSEHKIIMPVNVSSGLFHFLNGDSCGPSFIHVQSKSHVLSIQLIELNMS